jgi:dihydrofolate synthase/folylpolyglutamate synthase
VSTSPRAELEPAGAQARAAGWSWLATLPRPATPHAARGEDPLATVRALLGALGDPHQGLRVIHIAGSKGKGSTTLYCETLLRGLGRRTLAFTSPHLQRWTERLRVDAGEVDGERGLAALEAVREAAARCGVTPGFFEALTVAALWLAAREGVDWTIVEAGVGGRADATNVVEPAITVLTGIELEHTDRLGSTREAITREKAGIIKRGAPAVVPVLEPALARIVDRAAAGADTEVVRVTPAPVPVTRAPGDRRTAWHWDGERLTAAGPGWAVRTGLATRATHAAANAALALTTVARLGLAPSEALQQAARGLAAMSLPGRAEVVSRLPWVLVDGAHTGASARALAATVRELRAARVHLLLSVSAGKTLEELLPPLLELADTVTVTQADADYSMTAHDLAEHIAALDPQRPVSAVNEPEPALARACSDRPGETLVVATGSVYLAGAVRTRFPTPD